MAMGKILLRPKSLSALFLVFLLILSGGVFMNLKLKLDRITRQKIPGSSIIYIPSGKSLKYATFGHSSLLADLVYLWAIQYYSDYSIPDRFNYLEHIFSIIAELDPHYFDPYDVGAFIAAYEAQDLELALQILDMGLEKNPEEWYFPYMAGHYLQFLKKDHERAQEYYRKSMAVEGAPPITRRLYANALFKATDYQSALKAWMEIYQTAEDERVRKIADNHIYQVKAAIDIENIKEAIARYREKYGHNPMELSQLVRAGLLPSLPRDLDGNDYLYDSRTGEVKVPTIPWKR